MKPQVKASGGLALVIECVGQILRVIFFSSDKTLVQVNMLHAGHLTLHSNAVCQELTDLRTVKGTMCVTTTAALP